MKKHLIPTLAVTFLSLLMVSCFKEFSCEHGDCLPKPVPPVIPPVINTTCDSSVCKSATDYLKAEINGLNYCFSSFYQQRPDTFYNVHIKDGASLQDQVNMIRNDECQRWSLQIFMSQSDIFKKSLPYVMPGTIGGGLVEIQIREIRKQVPCQFCPDDSLNYVGYPNPGGIKLTITDTTNSTLTGSFEGNVSTKTGKNAALRNGQFKIKIIKSYH